MFNKALIIGLATASLTSGLTLTNPQFAPSAAHAEPTVIALSAGQGSFQTASKATQGSVTIKSFSGRNYLRLDSNFSTESGPQVEVLLHQDTVPQVYNSNNYISLGEIKSFQGEQWYAIPEGTDLSQYQSVSIWCREFDVTFGFATLQTAKATSGQFQSGAKATQGEAEIKAFNGVNYLRLGSNFLTESGPQVEVLLHQDAVPQVYNSSNYISLGEIKSFEGEQWYAIPAGTDISQYQSISIWCREFDVTFGFATLPG